MMTRYKRKIFAPVLDKLDRIIFACKIVEYDHIEKCYQMYEKLPVT